jgi:hypothetical protein
MAIFSKNILTDAERSVQNLEERREVLIREHQAAVEARRKVLLDGSAEDLKLLTKVDDRVIAAERILIAVEDALVAARARVDDLKAKQAEETDRQQGEARVKQIEANVARLEKAHEATVAPLQDFILALRSCEIVEAKNAAAFVENTLAQLALEVPHLCVLLRDQANALGKPPSPPPVAAPPPKPPVLVYNPVTESRPRVARS